MHEWAIAESIVLTVVKEAEKRGLRSLDQIVLRIGELQKMEKEVLCLAMESLFSEYGYEVPKSKFLIYEEPGVFQCNFCGTEWEYSDSTGFLSEDEKEKIHFLPEVAHGFMKCPSCGSFDFEVKKGRGVLIESIVGDT
jgi:hydrogenase nickel incorporation protein HypA/HybF